ncbi:MAG: M13 family metallopeptidase [Polyangiaceae bacterium]|nr:M13 family metallopeptidase [Polyangiaceae bacterium]
MKRAALSSTLLLAAACGSSPPAPQAPVAAPSASVATPPKPPPTPRAVSLADVGLDAGALDKSVDPCGDFYGFACGGWIAKTEIPADKPRYSRGFSEIQKRNEQDLRDVLELARKSPQGEDEKKLGAYYGACMDEEAADKAGTLGLDRLRAIIRGVHDQKSLAIAIADLHKARVFALFDVSDDQDYKDATRVIATLDQNGLGLPDRDYYTKDDAKSKELVATYTGHVERLLAMGGAGKREAPKAAARIVAFETRLAKAQKTKVERRDPKSLYNKIDRDGLKQRAPSFDWDLYFSVLGFDGLRDINVTSLTYLDEIERAVKTEKPELWREYLELRLVSSLSATLPKPYVDEAFSLEKALTGQATQRARWKRCVDATDRALGELLAQSFVARRFGKDQKHAVEAMVFAIRDAFGEEVSRLDWMDEKTQARAVEKLKAMAYLIGYPSKWREYTFAVEQGAYTKTELAAREFETRRRLTKVGKPLDREEWQMTPPTVNAYYDPLKNHMVFPAGILQPPFYGNKQSLAVNAGGIGMVVGHELTHGFDDEGSQFAGNGNLENWWAPEVKGRFEKKATCVADQYSAYEALPGVKLNGRLTLGENIADIGGIKLAFRAYRKLRADAATVDVADGFTEDQQFFLAVGQAWCFKAKDEWTRMAASVDPHSPPKFRVNGALSDTPEFAAAFSCKEGAPMRPANACVVW